MTDEEKLRDYLKQVTAKLRQTRQRLREEKERSREPIAIVAMGCRYPGGVRSPEELWNLLESGGDAIGGFPQDRGWDVEGLFDPDPDHPGTSYAVAGGFLQGVGEFDPAFFGISPREALAMDPQQRLLLEVSWEALERAGIDPSSLKGSATGVFAGAFASGYGADLAGTASEGYLMTGVSTSVLSGRVSYTLGLEGPAVTIDTACSSSLVALHLACQALRTGECNLALAGGTTVLSTPAVFIGFSRQRGVSADGRCKSFGAGADGSGWAEGAGMVVLERLSDARRNGHQVLAIVAGSALNQDGASNGLTAPNGPSQQRVIRAALQNAGIGPSDVDVVEAHGSGTSLGDPIEAQAVIAAYGQGRAEDRPLWLGSVKSNIGHSQCAAGAAGIIKTVMSLRNQQLPRTLHVDEPSPLVNWSAGNVKLLKDPVAWPSDGERVRRAGVSAFGISGTNVHIILAEPPAEEPATGGEDDGTDLPKTADGTGSAGGRPVVPVVSGAVPWVVSGRSDAGLRAQAGRLREALVARPGLDARDVGWSLAVSRAVFEHRAVVLDGGADGFAGLGALAGGGELIPAAGVVSGVVSASGTGRSVFVFPGQGAQWVGMGRELLGSSPVFAARLAECGAVLEPLVGWSLVEVVAGSGSGVEGLGSGLSLGSAEVFQPVLWGVLVALAAVWESVGVVPDAVVGHSQGEVAAATVAGVLSLGDAARVVVARSRALSGLGVSGSMVSVVMPESRVRELMAPWGERLSVAAVNGPAAVVVSGEPGAVEEFEGALARARVLRWRLPVVDYVAHAAGADGLEGVLRAELGGIVPGPARVPMFSTVRGGWVEGPELDAGYWFANVRETVRFADAVGALLGEGFRSFVEVSAQPVLTGPVAECAEEAGVELALVTGTVEREDAGARRLVESFARAFVAGLPVDWAAVVGGGELVELPTYPFQRQRFWPEASTVAPAAVMIGGVEERFWASVESGDVAALAQSLSIEDAEGLAELVPALAAWRKGERERSATENWRYRVTWAPVAEPAAGSLTGRWLLVVPEGCDLAGSVEGALSARGAEVVTVEIAAGEPNRTGLAERLAAVTDGDVAGVVSLLALDEAEATGVSQVAAGPTATLALVQALGDAGVDRAPLWVVTRGAVAALPGEAPGSLVQAQVWGMGRVVGLEHPERWGGLVDLPEVFDERAGARLCAVLSGATGDEDQLAIRSTGIVGRRLTRAPRPRMAGEAWAPRGSVLVTGGTGAIGGHVAGWLAERGAPRIVLTSRSGPAASGVAATAARLAQAGSGVGVVACDIADRDQATGLVARIAADGPALTAVLHTAGVVANTAVAETTPDGLRTVLAAKAAGAALLDELTADADLDAFVLFSSIAATWGSGLQPAYAAANASLDALAEDRRSRGLPATSVAWGPWDGGGMTDAEGARYLERRGLKLMDPAALLRVLGEALDTGEARLTVADVDWARFAPAFTMRRPSSLIADLPEVAGAADPDEEEDASGPAGAGERTELGHRLAGLAPTDQERLLVGLVRADAAAVLGHATGDEVEPGRAFSDLGFDSVMAVELRNRLGAVSGLRLPATLLFDYPTPLAVGAYLREQLGGVPAGVSAAELPATVAPDGDPVAVVAMGCRFPGGVRTPEDLWELVASGTDAVSAFPTDRGWDIDAIYHPDPEHPGTSYVRAGGFGQAFGDFDPGFFGISPREALAMDPQQRLLLETSWEAFERAGIDPTALRGSQTGVFVGASPSGYSASLGDLDGHMITGNAASVMSGRISYVLGLQGPAVTVDTACSSALVALHQAAQALRNGECSLALAGGAWVTANPAVFVGFSQTQGLAPDGRCKAFGAGADGMGIGEGVGVLLLERLSDARRNGHDVLAVVRASAVNQDGASNGLTAPNGPSQQRVIRAALAAAGLTGDEVDAVEAHGTGTVLGDPIEAQALLATYGQERSEDHPLWLGSVKSNIGHTQAAAGVAGVIKMVMALRHGVLPRTLHAEEPSPHVDWSAGNVRLLTEPLPWTPEGRPRRAGVSAFGMSGTNVHTILEQAPEPPAAEPDGPATPLVTGVVPWPLTSRTADGLAAQAGRLARLTGAQAPADGDVAWSLATTRSVFEHRAVVLGGEGVDISAAEGVRVLAEGGAAPSVITNAAGDVGKAVFVFPGQGAQWVGMGRELYASSPVFAARLAECAAALAPLVEWSLVDVLLGVEGAPGLETAEVVQPALWAVMVSLAALWEAAGVTPDAVVGHSQGEVAAATVAGVLSLEDGARVVVVRSRALSGLGDGGGMVSVVMPEERVLPLMEPWGDRLSVAAVNAPAATVVSGEARALEEFEAELAKARIMRWRVPETDFVAHSARVEALEPLLAAELAGVTARAGRVPMFSTALSRWLAGEEADAGYWYANVRRTVRFADAVRALAGEGFHTFIEVSPHPTLEAAVADTFDDTGTAVVPVVSGTTHQDSSGAVQLLSVMARAWAKGVPVDWAKVVGGGTRVDLPTYAFQRRRYWPEPAAVRGPGAASPAGEGSSPAAEAEFWSAVENGDLRALGDTLALDGRRSFDEVVPALAAWRRRARERAVTDSWRYRVSWTAVADPDTDRLTGTWLVVTPPRADSPAEPIAAALRGRGAHVVEIEGDTGREVLARRLAAAADDGTGLSGVVSLLALEEAALPGLPEVPAGLAGTLALVQALGDLGFDAPLWALTRGAVATGAGEALTNPLQAQVWGLGRVVALESRDRWGGLIDLPPVLDDRAAARLCGVLAGCGEDQVALRGAGITARRLVHAPRAETAPRAEDTADAWTGRGTALLTGGTGALAAQVADWLAARGTERVVLTSRSGAGAAGAATLAADLAARGTRVEIVACDAAVRGQVAGVLARIGAGGPPLTAVVHTAGTLDDGLLDGLDAHRLASVLAAKALGATHLHELTADLDLDAFVLFSSAAATLGGAGQGNYAAANAYLDALAEHRAGHGLTGVSLAWGPWAGGGVAEANDAVRQRMRRGALPPMEPDLALKVFGHALTGPDSLLAVMDVDWPQFATAPAPFIADLPEVAAAVAESAATPADGNAPAALDKAELAEQLGGMPPAEQERALIELVRTGASAVLGHGSTDTIDADRAFSDLGFDSLTSLEMRQQVSRVTGLRLPATLLFDHPTPAVLARHLRVELFGDAEAVPEAPAAPAAPTPAAATGDDPVVIVAMGCRYPGDVRDPDGFWRMLATGTDAIGDFPRDREWPLDQLYDADSSREGTSYVRGGGFVHEAPDFDAAFFGISPREALAMDPQQRVLLEVSWEALERAGFDPRALRGTRTGVFVGGATSNYGAGLQTALQGSGGLEGHLMTGNATSVLSGRVSYALGLEGPAVTVDTACSSSLVTLHLAAQALRNGECDLALAGGVTIMATPGDLVSFSRQRGLAADGRSKAFSASADGMGMAEGVGMLVVERLSDARRNGHRVLAVVRGSAVNQDGASNGLTAPNGPSQQRVIRAALASAGLTAADVDAVEAHGTGTELGDPIEAQALMATYGQGRGEQRPLWLGSVKSNIGHTQAAAGAAGLMKMVLALQHAELPRTLHADEPSPHIDWTAGNVRLLTEPREWPADGDRPRRAGVSSFGISGTNAHVLLEEAPAQDASEPAREPVPGVLPGTTAVPWVVSGRTDAALRDQAGRLRELVVARPETGAREVGWSLASSRSVLEYRAVVVEGRAEGLAAVATGQPASGVVTSGGVAAGRGRVGFVFAGQGSQRAGMAAGLYAASPVFAVAFDRVCGLLGSHLDVPLREVVLDGVEGDGRADLTVFAQAGLFALQVGLVEVLKAAGVRPAAVAGHSVGEVAAAYVAGVLSLEDACALVAGRGRVMQALPEGGAMASIAVSEAEVRAEIGERADVGIAAVNGPAAVVVSGERDAVDAVAGVFAGRGVRVRSLRVSHAFHSHRMDPALDELARIAGGLTYGQAGVPWVSTSTGAVVESCDGSYWAEQARGAVRYADAVTAMAGLDVDVFLEIGPDGTLSTLGTETAPDAEFVSLQRPGHDAAQAFVTGLGRAWVRGAEVDWAALIGTADRVELPTYAFQSRRFWPVPVPRRQDAASVGLDTTGHPLLAAAVGLAAGGGLILTGALSPAAQPWLPDHAVGGSVLLPGTAFVEMAVRAGDLAGCGRLDELTLESPLPLPGGSRSVQVQVVVGEPDRDGCRGMEIHSRPADADGAAEWTRHATGRLAPSGAADRPEELAVWPPQGATPVPMDGFYDRLVGDGYAYGPTFRGLTAVWRRGEEVFAEIALPEQAAADAAAYGLHPALLDAALHASMLAGPVVKEAGPGEILLPFAWQGVSLHASGAAALRVRLTRDAHGDGLALDVADAAGAPVLTVASMVSLPVPATRLGAAAGPATPEGLFAVDWTPIGGDAPAGRVVLVGPDPYGLAAAGTGGTGGLPGSGSGAEAPAPGIAGTHPDLDALAAAVAAGEPVPDVVLACAGMPPAGGGDVAASARAAAGQALSLVQRWLAADDLAAARLVLVTRGAVATGPGEDVTDMGGAALWGLVRSAQSENPERLVLADLPADGTGGADTLLAALGAAEPELAVRAGVVHARRLARPAAGLIPPSTGAWRLEAVARGTLDGLALVEHPPAERPLDPGEIRVAVRAAGVNFRDVMATLDLLPLDRDPDGGLLGSEVAGVVTEVGSDAGDVAVGDRVMGMLTGGAGPVAVLDARLAAPVPAGLTFAQGAAIPVAFATAWYGLVDLARARRGQKVLIHAAAGGVGMAAVAIARHLGLEVYATASPAKWGALTAAGLDEAHLASSRDARFEERFLAATGGAGVDLVLNALAGELTDASLRLLRAGGEFVEMGKTDIRDAEQIASAHPGVRYRAFSTGEAGPDRLAEILAEVTALLATGQLAAPPVRCWDIRRAPDALRFMSQARHVGKIVLTVPAAPRPAGTVLLTGGTGTLAGLVAQHLADSGRAGRLVLASRSGPAAAGVPALAARLAGSGAGTSVVSCDSVDRATLSGLLDGLPSDRPLTSVVHLAGVLDDAVVTSLTGDRLDAVMRPKADAAWNLHELTADLDLDAFVLFSSAAATFGGSGQGNYAAANAFLDGLAAHRSAAGLAATSLDWGLWAEASSMTGELTEGQKGRIARSGMAPLPADTGLALLDTAVRRDEPHLVTALLDVPAMRAKAARGEQVPALWRGLAGGAARPTAGAAPVAEDVSLVRQLGGMAPEERDRMLTELVRAHAADVLGHSSRDAVEPGRAFKDLGFDSLTSVELRNRLNLATGLRLAPTLVFDRPTSAAIAEHLRDLLFADEPDTARPTVFDELSRLEATLDDLSADHETRADVTRRMRAILSRWIDGKGAPQTGDEEAPVDLDQATPTEVFDFLDRELGSN
ncbi:type I polyketide synthase [Actinacidiphila reveromycinica]|nr:type I polyketide synthase [Streptomyces sp. SN-593]